MSKKLNIEQDSGRLRISYNWRTGAMWFLLVWSIFWNLGMFVAIGSGAGWFISLHLVAGIFVAWLTLTRFVNRTTVTVDRSSLKMSHGPVPWPFAPSRDIPSRALRQLYVDKSSVKVNEQPTYNLMAILDTGAEVALVKSQQDLRLVQDLEKTIETFLDIADDPTLNLSESGKTPDEMRRMLEGITRAREAAEKRSWIPEFVKEQMRDKEEALRSEMARHGQSAPDRTASRPPSRPSTSFDDEPEITLRTAPGTPRELPRPDHDFAFPLYAQPAGASVRYLDQAYRLGRSAQIDWTDKHISAARQLELQPASGVTNLYFYAQFERERWAYYEERRLDDDEVAALGFTGTHHPLRFNNGEERYYPRDRQEGTRFVGGRAQPVEQYIYFTTSSVTQFRALQPAGGSWEVYVMEPVDGGAFADV